VILLRVLAWLLTAGGMLAAFVAAVLFADLLRDVDTRVLLAAFFTTAGVGLFALADRAWR
jgi:hypothetical protein